MQRLTIDSRPNWAHEVSNLGYDFHDPAGIPNWSENAYYMLSQVDVDRLADAAREVFGLLADAAQHVIDQRLFPLIGIPPALGNKITENWNADIPAILGQFKFLYDGVNDPKLIAYDADVVGNLFESAIVQRNWRDWRFPDADQFNRLDEVITQRWRDLQVGRYNANSLHVTANGAIPEEVENVRYVGDCARRAGYTVNYLAVEEIGTFEGNFYDLQNQVMTQVYKQYPWDLFRKDAPFEFIDYAKCWWMEPMWKMLMQCKGLLPVLWEMYTEHPNLLPAYSSPGVIDGAFVKKPIWGRHGANIQVVVDDKIVAQGHHDDKYRDDGYIYQAFADTANLDGRRPVFGVWIVGDDVCGLGIREDSGMIIQQHSHFVPHIIR